MIVEGFARVAEFAQIDFLVVNISGDAIFRCGGAIRDKDQALHFFDICLTPADDIGDLLECIGINRRVEDQEQAAFSGDHIGNILP